LPPAPRFRGTLAWLAWLGLHIVTLLGNRNRIAALINLSWRYVAWNHGGGLIVGDEQPPDARAARFRDPDGEDGDALTARAFSSRERPEMMLGADIASGR
jgi:hypothetical protein